LARRGVGVCRHEIPSAILEDTAPLVERIDS
jgi:hypothetical protein